LGGGVGGWGGGEGRGAAGWLAGALWRRRGLLRPALPCPPGRLLLLQLLALPQPPSGNPVRPSSGGWVAPGGTGVQRPPTCAAPALAAASAKLPL
jgi:hypothetical protein